MSKRLLYLGLHLFVAGYGLNAAQSNVKAKFLFPCHIVNYRLNDAGVEEMACDSNQQDTFEAKVNLLLLDTTGQVIGTPIAATLHLIKGKQWSALTVDGGGELTKDQAYRLTTFYNYTIGKTTRQYAVDTFDFTFPPKTPFPCAVTDFRIVSERELRIKCDIPLHRNLSYQMKITEVQGDNEGLARDATLTLDPQVEAQWARVVPTEFKFEKDKAYRLRSVAVANSTEKTMAKFDFKTEATATISIPNDGGDGTPRVSPDGRARFLIASTIALAKPKSSTHEVLVTEDLQLMRSELDVTTQLLFPDFNGDTESIGRAFLWIAPPGPRSLNSLLKVKGLNTVLGNPVTVPDGQPVQLPGAPKTKDDSVLYGKFLNQAGPGAKPGWAADIKFAPVLGYAGAGFFFAPQVLVNIGLGSSVENAKIADLIHVGMGLTRYVQLKNAQAFPGIQLTPQIAFETDREGHHQNLIFDGDLQVFGRGWLNSIKDRNYREVAARTSPGLTKAPDVTKLLHNFGYSFQAFLGTEIGGALSSDTWKSSDKATSVVLPRYSIGRLRPKVVGTLEWKRLTLSFNATPRYLFTAETVTKEVNVTSTKDPTKLMALIYSRLAKGLRAYGEASISFQLDKEGHVAFSTVYKLGSLPPNFSYVNTVQTGIQFVY